MLLFGRLAPGPVLGTLSPGRLARVSKRLPRDGSDLRGLDRLVPRSN